MTDRSNAPREQIPQVIYLSEPLSLPATRHVTPDTVLVEASIQRWLKRCVHVKLKLKLACDFVLGSVRQFWRCLRLLKTESNANFSFRYSFVLRVLVLHVDTPSCDSGVVYLAILYPVIKFTCTG